ncbi:MAG: 3-deoxy-D-manno-octulosonic acid transferase [Planctomycetota bacterium]|nr:MAG: 3-deoxy-D-manno-octulosonic acid transferase [Planctomycetota bacterium]
MRRPRGKGVRIVAYLLNCVYLLLLVALAPWFVAQSLLRGKYREGFAAKFLGLVPRRTSNRRCVWFHAVSVGEVNLLGPLVEQIGERHAGWECVVSTTTMTGYALARTRYPDLCVFYCPLDFSWSVRNAIRRVRPDVLVLAELELWPNLVRAAGEIGAKVAIVNGRLSDRSFRGYRRIRPIVARLLTRVDLIAAQNEEYAERFLALGAAEESVRVTGSIKFDNAATDRDNPKTKRLRELAGISATDIVFLAGSTQHPEESLALAAFAKLAPDWPNLRLILVPRHPDRFDEVAALLDASGICWQRRSSLGGPAADPQARALLVDTVGELGAWWGTAHIAVVGGSLSRRGGQNMIEPAAYGAAVAFGPNTWNFRDVVAALLAADAAKVVRNGEEMAEFVRWVLASPDAAAAMGARAQRLVRGQLGATERTIDALATVMDCDRAAPEESGRYAA